MAASNVPTPRGPGRRVAIYWDFENMVRSQYRRAYCPAAGDDPWKRDTEAQRLAKAMEADAQIKVDSIVTYAASLGEVAINRAYCTWDRPVFGWYAPRLSRNFTEMTQLFTEDAGKNGADISIAIDLVDDLRRDEGITDVLLCTGDGDFLPVVHVCSRSNCRLYAVAVAGSTSPRWVNHTIFRYHHKLDPTPADVVQLARQRGAWAHDHAGLVNEALRQLPDGHWVTTDRFDILMRSVCWIYNADPTSVGSVDQLVRAGSEAGLLEVSEIGGVPHVRLRPTTDASTSAAV